MNSLVAASLRNYVNDHKQCVISRSHLPACYSSSMAESSHGIIINGVQEATVWPLSQRVRCGWRFAGPTGTEAEMEEVSERSLTRRSRPSFDTSPIRRRFV